jgi:hypothetical protein
LNERSGGAVRRMTTRIRLLAQPESMRSIIGATLPASNKFNLTVSSLS